MPGLPAASQLSAKVRTPVGDELSCQKTDSVFRRYDKGQLAQNRQLVLGGLRFFSTSASVIIIISGSTAHS